MRDRRAELVTSRGEPVDVVVVTFTKPRNLSGYRRRYAEPFTVVTDPERELYRRVGYGRGSVWRVYGWKVIRRYAQLLRAGARMSKSNEDTLQLGGNVLVDADGTVVWRYAGAGPDERPSVDEIVAAVATI